MLDKYRKTEVVKSRALTNAEQIRITGGIPRTQPKTNAASDLAKFADSKPSPAPPRLNLMDSFMQIMKNQAPLSFLNVPAAVRPNPSLLYNPPGSAKGPAASPPTATAPTDGPRVTFDDKAPKLANLFQSAASKSTNQKVAAPTSPPATVISNGEKLTKEVQQIGADAVKRLSPDGGAGQKSNQKAAPTPSPLVPAPFNPRGSDGAKQQTPPANPVGQQQADIIKNILKLLPPKRTPTSFPSITGSPPRTQGVTKKPTGAFDEEVPRATPALPDVKTPSDNRTPGLAKPITPEPSAVPQAQLLTSPANPPGGWAARSPRVQSDFWTVSLGVSGGVACLAARSPATPLCAFIGAAAGVVIDSWQSSTNQQKP